MQTTFAKDVTVDELQDKFGLEQTEEQSQFREWQDDLPEISEAERQVLNHIKSNFKNLNRDRPMSEEAVKMVVLSPLLDLAGFYQPPFKLLTEQSTEISAEDEGTLYKGSIDVLVVLKRFWILVIESKSTRFDVMMALPQALTYLLSCPERVGEASPLENRPPFALLINGREFVFVKLIPTTPPQYILSKAFSLLNPSDDLADVLRVLKRIGKLIEPNSNAQ